MKRSRIIILAAVLVLLILGVGSCRKMGTWLRKSEVPEHADVMVMLMGDITDRSLQVADLYRKKLADEIWIVDSGMDRDRARQLRGIHYLATSDRARYNMMGLGIPSESIHILPGGANSTRMEAEIVRDHLRNQNEVDTLLLVTSSYHTRRAFLIFNSAFHSLEEPPALYVSPSIYTRFDAQRWWTHKRDVYQVALESAKLANFYLFERRQLRKAKR